MSITMEAGTRTLPTGSWAIDPVHSSVDFEVDYLGGAFRGQFSDVEARLAVDESTFSLEGSAAVASVEVKDENLEAHLQSPDFFDAERYPRLGFEASEIVRSDDGVKIPGKITIKGVTQPVELTGRISEPITDYAGRERIGLRVETTVDRTTFGVNWNNPLPNGKPALSDQVKLTADLYFVREA